MAKKFVVTPAQRNAAEGLLKRGEAKGKPIRPAIRKIANATVQPIKPALRNDTEPAQTKG